MFVINENTIGQAHESVINYISDNSTCLKTEDGECTIETGEPIAIKVNNPLQEPMISSASLFKKGFADTYKNSFYSVTLRKNDGTDAVYTYGNRLCDYFSPTVMFHCSGKRTYVQRIFDKVFSYIGYMPSGVANYIKWKGDGNSGGINQIHTSIIDRIVKSPNTRRAIAITWSPNHDIEQNEPPCLQSVYCRVRPHTSYIDLTALFRSNDMLSAWGQNAYGLAYLQKYIVDEINKRSSITYSVGTLETISLSAHIYYTRDCLELSRFKDKADIVRSYSSFQRT